MSLSFYTTFNRTLGVSFIHKSICHMTLYGTRHMTAESLCVSLHISILERVEMKKAIPYEKPSLTKRVLRFLGISGSVDETPSYQEITHVPIPTDGCYGYSKEINTALMEAEDRKAKAIEWQRRHFIC